MRPLVLSLPQYHKYNVSIKQSKVLNPLPIKGIYFLSRNMLWCHLELTHATFYEFLSCSLFLLYYRNVNICIFLRGVVSISQNPFRFPLWYGHLFLCLPLLMQTFNSCQGLSFQTIYFAHTSKLTVYGLKLCDLRNSRAC